MPRRPDRPILVAFADPNLFHAGDSAAQSAPERFSLPNFIAHAQRAEAAGFDAVFKPDFLGLETVKSEMRPRSGFEPLTLMTALSQHTQRVGLITTESTSFTEPFNIARFLTSLDHLSNGRASWNVVTSYYGEENFGDGKLLPLKGRYEKAEEFMEIAYRLWDGWKDGAAGYRDGAHRVNGDLIEGANFEGTHFKVKNALDVPPGPQRRPVIVQAGASEEGLTFAARHAEIVFTATPDQDAARSFYADLKRRVVAAGRAESSLKILPGLNLFVAGTKAAAREAHRQQFTDANLRKYRDKLVREAPLFRLEALDLDDPVPASAIPSEEALNQVERRRSRGLLLHRYLNRPGEKLRTILENIFEFGHVTLIGTADEVATQISAWHDSYAVDGFVFKGGNSFAAIAGEVLPLLEERGVLRRPPPEARTFRQALFS